MTEDTESTRESEEIGSARYVFGVRVRLEADESGVWVEPATVETKLYREADPPGEEGWLFFRDNCWRGELADERFMRSELEETLGVPVESVDFRELRTDQAYLDALKAEIDENLDAFNAESVTDVLHSYLGSSIHVVE